MCVVSEHASEPRPELSVDEFLPNYLYTTYCKSPGASNEASTVVRLAKGPNLSRLLLSL